MTMAFLRGKGIFVSGVSVFLLTAFLLFYWDMDSFESWLGRIIGSKHMMGFVWLWLWWMKRPRDLHPLSSLQRFTRCIKRERDCHSSLLNFRLPKTNTQERVSSILPRPIPLQPTQTRPELAPSSLSSARLHARLAAGQIGSQRNALQAKAQKTTPAKPLSTSQSRTGTETKWPRAPHRNPTPSLGDMNAVHSIGQGLPGTVAAEPRHPIPFQGVFST